MLEESSKGGIVILFAKSRRSWEAWVDADFAGDVITRRATSVLVMLFAKYCINTLIPLESN